MFCSHKVLCYHTLHPPISDSVLHCMQLSYCTLHSLSVTCGSVNALLVPVQADYDDVCYYSLDIFRRKFEYFRDNIKEMETLFGAHFQSFTEEARRMTRCHTTHHMKPGWSC